MPIVTGPLNRQRRKHGRLFNLLVIISALPLILAISAFACPTINGITTVNPYDQSGNSSLSANSFTQLHMFDARHGWATSPNAILTTSNGGVDWTNVTPVEWTNAFNGTPTSDINASSGNIVQSFFLNARDGWIISLSHNNTTPTAGTNGAPPPIVAAPQKVYVLATVDSGTTWMAATPIDVNGIINVLRPDFISENEGWLEVGVLDGTTYQYQQSSGGGFTGSGSGEGIRVYHSVDGGITWGDPVAATQALPTPGPTRSPVVRPPRCYGRGCNLSSVQSSGNQHKVGLPAIINLPRKTTQASSNGYTSNVTSAVSNTDTAQKTLRVDGSPPTDGTKVGVSAMVNCINPVNLTPQELSAEFNTPHCPTAIPPLTADTQGCTVTGTTDTLLWTSGVAKNERWLSGSTDSGANWSAPTDGFIGQILSTPPAGTPGAGADSNVVTGAPFVMNDGTAFLPVQTQLYPDENSSRSEYYSLTLEFFHIQNGGGGASPAVPISSVSSINPGAAFNTPLFSSQQDMSVVDAKSIWAAGTAYDDSLNANGPPQITWNIYQFDPASRHWKTVGGTIPKQLTTISILDMIANGKDATGHATGYTGWAVDGSTMYRLTMDNTGAVTAWDIIYSYASTPAGSPVPITPTVINGVTISQKVPKLVPGKIVAAPTPAPQCAGAPTTTPQTGPFTPTVTGAEQTISDVGITAYGYNDNSGTTETQYSSSDIAYARNQGYPTAHNMTVEGAGTYADPITAAAPPRDTKTGGIMPPGTMVYVPFLEKYFIIEDECGDTDPQGCNQGAHHLDLFMGPSIPVPQQFVQKLNDCEGSITYQAGQKTVIINPANHSLPVEPTKMFLNNTCTVVQH